MKKTLTYNHIIQSRRYEGLMVLLSFYFKTAFDQAMQDYSHYLFALTNIIENLHFME